MNCDAAGNLTHDTYTGNGARVYDAEGRIVQATDNGGQTARYVYSPDGERMRRWINGVEWWSAYGLDGEMQLDYTRALTSYDHFVYRNGELIVKSEYQAASNSFSRKWMVADQLGTPRMIADESGSLAGISRHDMHRLVKK